MTHLFLVILGGGLGAGARHLCGQLALRMLGAGFPYATLFVNVAGSLIMGLFIGWLARRAGGSSQELRLFLATGFLGGFTTFSAFSLDVAVMWQRGDITPALLYVATSVVLSIVAVFCGLWIMRSMA